jgi:hypothetical protein
MIAYFFLGVVLLAVLLLLIKTIASIETALLAKLLKGFAIAFAVAGVVYIVVAGRAGIIAAAVPIFVPFLVFWLRRRRSLAGAGSWEPGSRPHGSGRSDVETAFFAMSLDHATGRLDGWIKKTRFAGRRLSELARNELLQLRREVAGDADSVSVLEAFLDRTQGTAWRGPGDGEQERTSDAGSGGGAMTREEAYEILGLKPGAKEAEIRDAHHRLMKKLHPDQGGSDYLAARVNRARDILLGT